MLLVMLKNIFQSVDRGMCLKASLKQLNSLLLRLLAVLLHNLVVVSNLANPQLLHDQCRRSLAVQVLELFLWNVGSLIDMEQVF